MNKHMRLFVCDSTVQPESKGNVKVVAQTGHLIIVSPQRIFGLFLNIDPFSCSMVDLKLV